MISLPLLTYSFAAPSSQSHSQARKDTQMEFPAEILLNIFSNLQRTDLKAARQVSKTWRVWTSQFLFEDIFVSSAKDNLEIFEAVAGDPLLS